MKRKLLSFLFFSLGVCSLWAQDLALVDSLEQQKSLYEQLKKRKFDIIKRYLLKY